MHDGSFPVEVISGVPVVTAPREIDITNAPALRSALFKAATHWQGTLAVDMTQTSFCDSSGLHTLLAAQNASRLNAVSCCWSSPPLPCSHLRTHRHGPHHPQLH